MKFLIGGSPCTHWSIAQSKNRETEASGVGWELFRNFLIAKEKFKPDYFLYENNHSISKAIKEQITKELGVDPIMINSALVSAQNRKRCYWTNIPDIEQPEDRGILLKDILDSGQSWTEKSYALTTRCGSSIPEDTLKRHRHTMIAEPLCVAQRGRYTGEGGKVQQNFEPRKDGKTNTLTTVTKDNLIAEQIRIGCFPNSKGEIINSQSSRIYSIKGKSASLCAGGGGMGAKTGLYAILIEESNYEIIDRAIRRKDGALQDVYVVKDGLIEIKGKSYLIKLPDGSYIIRKLTVAECCRLQTMPDDYCRAVSKTQAYKGLGNGWTAEVIIHILSSALSEMPRNEEIKVLSMYDGIGTGRHCFDKLGFNNIRYFAYEIDKYAIKIAQSNYPDIIQCGDAFQVREENWIERFNFIDRKDDNYLNETARSQIEEAV